MPSAVPSIGWRSPRPTSSDNKIRFTDASAPIATPTAAVTQPAATNAAVAPATEQANSVEFELQLRAAALAAKMVAEEKAAEAAEAARAAAAAPVITEKVAVVTPLPATTTPTAVNDRICRPGRPDHTHDRCRRAASTAGR